MQWKGPILTDSGGFQVFSLGDIRKSPNKACTSVTRINGDPIFLDPEKSRWRIQYDLGSDIVMIFDECTPYPLTGIAKRSMEMSLRWAKRSRSLDSLGNKNALFWHHSGQRLRRFT